MQILSFPEEEIPLDLRVQVRQLQEEAWPSEPDGEEADPPESPVHDPLLRPLSVLLVDGGVVLSALDILTKEVVHAGRYFTVGGLSTVATRERARGRGYGQQLVSAARELMSARNLDLGLFTCDRSLRAFYERAGWHVLPGAVLIGGTPQDPFPSDQPGFDKLTMANFFSAEGRRAEATFRASRIGLFPGQIDKLW
ncbi:GNAT family N-acetyltransferase [Streptomyces sp. NPDC055897]